MLDGLDGLGHDAIVRRHHQDDDVRNLGTAGPHRREGGVTRGIQEGDHAPTRLDVIGADVLGDAARLARRHLGAANVVEERGLAVIDVAHDSDHGWPRFQGHLAQLTLQFEHEGVLDALALGGNGLMTHLLHQQGGGIRVQGLVDGDRQALLEQFPDDIRHLGGHARGQFADGDGRGNLNLAHHLHGGTLEAMLIL